MARAQAPPAPLAAALTALLLLAAAPAADAGCKRGGLRRTAVPPEERSFNHQPAPQLAVEELPKQWDWNNREGRSLLAPSWNQHIPQYCGSCWLHGTTSMIQDRLKIVKGGLGPDVMLARQVILNCGAYHGYGQGCDGGDVIDVVRYMAAFGLPDESCQPYSATDHTKYGGKTAGKKCPAEGYCMNCMPIKDVDTCWAVHTPMRYYLSSYGTVEAPGEAAMMSEIYARGPITCSMATPEDFDYGYHRGVAVDTSNSTDVDHDVEVVGWGQEEGPGGLKYWIVRNSWGTFWGEMGFFKLQRGVNALQIEAGDCWYAVPTWQDEQDVRAGRKVGTMWGIFDAEEAAHIKPEPHRHPHFIHDDNSAAGGAASSAAAASYTAATADGATPEDHADGADAAAAALRKGRHSSGGGAGDGKEQPQQQAAALRVQLRGGADATLAAERHQSE